MALKIRRHFPVDLAQWSMTLFVQSFQSAATPEKMFEVDKLPVHLKSIEDVLPSGDKGQLHTSSSKMEFVLGSASSPGSRVLNSRGR